MASKLEASPLKQSRHDDGFHLMELHMHIFLQHKHARLYSVFRQIQGAGTESSDSKLAEGRAALDDVTNILTRTSGVDTRLLAALRRGNNSFRLWRSLRHIFRCRICETVSAHLKKNNQ